MKKVVTVFFVFCFLQGFAQDQEDILAREYFKNGEFEKARLSYEQLVSKKPYHINYIVQLIKTQQQLENYDAVQTLLLEKIEKDSLNLSNK